MINKELIEKAAQAIYDSEEPYGGDFIAELIGSADAVEVAAKDKDDLRERIMTICRIAAEAALSVDRWQPIETAPKGNGKWRGPAVLIACPRRGVLIARYDPDSFAKKPRPFWKSADAVYGVLDDRSDQPTHWMTLPEPLTD